MECVNWQEILNTAGPWIAPIITVVLTWWLYRRKYEAEVNDVFVNSASNIVAMYEKTFQQWKCRVEKLERHRNELQSRIEDIETKYKEQYREAKRRMKLLAKVIVSMLDYRSNGDPCIEDFIDGINVSKDDRIFLNEIIDEVNHN